MKEKGRAKKTDPKDGLYVFRVPQENEKEQPTFLSKLIKCLVKFAPKSCENTCESISYDFILCICVLIPIGVIVGFTFLIVFQFVPFNLQSTSLNPIPNIDLIQLNLSRTSYVEILDSSECKLKFNQNVCLEESYNYSYQTSNKFDFTYKIHIDEEILIKKMEISCDSKCDVYFNNNLRIENLFLYGNEMSINANQIKSNNIFFDSYSGNFKAENIIFEEASLNTSQGDIILQTQESISLSTITKEKYVCVTSKKYWKNNILIKNLSEAFEEKDVKTGDCLFVHKYENRDNKRMVQFGQHSVLDRLQPIKYTNSYETRCNFINELILMNNDNNPSSVVKFKKIKASNSEGNVYVNVLSNPNQLEQQINNSYQQNSNVKLSQESLSFLNDTIRSIKELGQTNEIIYLDFRQSSDYIHNFVYVMIFDPIYLFISTSYLSALSFSSLGSADQQKEMFLKPGICPFIFKYSMTGDLSQQEELVKSNESLILETINSFLEEEDISPYLIVTWEDYNNFKIKDQSTYPDVENINKKLSLVKSIEIICIIIIIGFTGVSFLYICKQLRQLTKNDNRRDLQKIFYFFLSNDCQIYQYQISQNETQKNDSKNETSKDVNQNQTKKNDSKNQISKNVSQNQLQMTMENLSSKSFLQTDNDQNNNQPIFLGCEIKRKRSQHITTTFQSLSTRSFIWLQIRFQSSISLFIKQLIKKIQIPEQKSNDHQTPQNKQTLNNKQTPQNKQLTFNKNQILYDQITNFQIPYSDLKQHYQLFCYIFNLQEECIYDLIDQQHEQFELQYTQTIFFKKYDNPKLEDDEFLVHISRSMRNQINYFYKKHIQKKQIKCESMDLSLFYFLYFNPNLKEQFLQTSINEDQSVLKEQNNGKQDLAQGQEDNKNEQQIKRNKSDEEIHDDNNNQNQQNQQSFKFDDDIQTQNIVPQEATPQESFSDTDLLSDDRFDEDYDPNHDDFYIFGNMEQKIFTKKNNISQFKRKGKKKGDKYTMVIDLNFLHEIKNLSADFLVSNEFKTKEEIETKKYEQTKQKITQVSPSESVEYKIKENQLNQENIKNIDKIRKYDSKKMKEITDLKHQINSTFIISQFSHPITYLKISLTQILSSLQINFRTVCLYLLYFISPFIGCGLIIVFISLYLRQRNNFDIEIYNSRDEIKLIRKIFDFSYIGLSLLTYTCITFIFLFYALLVLKNRYIFTDIKKNCYEGTLQIVKTLEQSKYGLKEKSQQEKSKENINNNRRFYLFYCIIHYIEFYYFWLYDLIQWSIQILSLTYLYLGVLILVIGTLIFPKVQLPTLIFFGALIGVFIKVVMTFNTQYESGKKKIKDLFVNNFKENAKKYFQQQRLFTQMKDENIKDNQTYEDFVEKFNKKKNDYIKQRKEYNEEQIPLNFVQENSPQRLLSLREVKNEQEEKDFVQTFEQNADNYLQSNQKKIQEIIEQKQPLNFIKDTKVHKDHDYKDIFDQLEFKSDKELNENEFKIFLANIEMELNQFQLNQLYSHMLAQQDTEFIQFWKIKKGISCKQFGEAIDYIMEQKVQMAFHQLDVSYASLCLSIIETLFKSVIIAWILYSVFQGVSADNQTIDLSSSFEFNSNSILSLGSVIGIILNKKDKGEVFEDDELVNSTVDKVEKQMHEN